MKIKLLRILIIMFKCTVYGVLCQCLFLNLLMASTAEGQRVTELRKVQLDLNLNSQDVHLGTLFHLIENETAFTFARYDKNVDKIIHLRSNRVNENLYNLLKEVSKQADLKFKRINNIINVGTIKRKKSEEKIILEEVEIEGKVVDENGAALPGANVTIKGTIKGTVTDLDGFYRILVEPGQTLVFSSIGFETVERVVGNESTINVTLISGIERLSEVVVTALGISKEKRALGYSVDNVDSERLNYTGEANMLLNLAGKAAGVQVQGSANGVDGTPRVLIRGVTSLSADNQPLYVLDGMPLQSNRSLSEDLFTPGNGSDFGNPLSDINPNDIESISVLKGASATALYGARGANGVIMITTKKGKSGQKGIGVTYSGSFTFQNPLTLPDVQTEYGQGFNGEFEYVDGNGGGTRESDVRLWGPRYEGQQIAQWDPLTNEPIVKEWKPYGKDNLKNFFETGHSYLNNVSMTHVGESSNTRISIGHQDIEGIVPNTGLERITGSLNSTIQLGEKLSATITATGSKMTSDNRSAYGFFAGAFWNALFIPTNIDIRDLRNHKDEFGNRRSFYRGGPNPYWDLLENVNPSTRRRFSGGLNLTYELTDWLSVQGSLFEDRNSTEYERITAKHAFNNGEYQEGFNFNEELNAEARLNFNKDVIEEFNVGAMIGTATRREKSINKFARTEGGLLVREVYNLSNSANSPIVNNTRSEKEVNSVFGSVDLNYKNIAFLTFTGRNDWSSTLPEDEWSFFYPSVSGSFVFSDVLNINERILSFGKVRASWAKVGNDTQPYSLDRFISREAVSFNGQPVLGLGSGTRNFIPAVTLKPEESTSFEIGTELYFLNDKVRLDVAYYNNESSNQLVRVENAWERGARFAFINAGTITNKGWEVKLDVTPVKNNNFSWDVSLNWSRNRGTVSGFPEELVPFKHIAAWFGPEIRATNGEPYGHMVGFEYFRDTQDALENVPNMAEDFAAFGYTAEGNIYGTGKVLTRNGFPMHNQWRGTRDLGVSAPLDWTGGIFNTINYKNFQLSFLFDFRSGGHVISTTQIYMLRYGMLTESAGTNADGGFVRDDVADGGGFLFDGIDVETGQPNTTKISTQDLYSGWNFPTETFTTPATNIKLKELSIGYRVPADVVSKVGIAGARVSLIGRNLWLIKNNLNGIDSETASMGPLNNGAGFETGSLPNTRSYGFNITLDF